MAAKRHSDSNRRSTVSGISLVGSGLRTEGWPSAAGVAAFLTGAAFASEGLAGSGVIWRNDGGLFFGPVSRCVLDTPKITRLLHLQAQEPGAIVVVERYDIQNARRSRLLVGDNFQSNTRTCSQPF